MKATLESRSRIGGGFGPLPILLLACVLLAAWISPAAWAGSPDDPEIVDPCPEVFPDEQMPYGDVCAAWFEGLWDPVYAQGRLVDWKFHALRATLELGGDVEDRPTQTWAYQLSWRVGECQNYWYIRDTLNGGSVPTLGQRCPDDEDQSWDIPATNVGVAGDRITVTIPLSGFAAVGASYIEGTELARPTAHVQLTVEPRGIVQVAQGWEDAGPGRTFVIGQDKPAVEST